MVLAGRRNGAIGEPDVIELDAAGTVRNRGHRGFGDFDRRIKQLKYAFGGCHRRLQDVVLFAEVLDRPEETLGILNKRHQNSDSYGARHRVEREMSRTETNCDLGKADAVQYLD